MSGPEKRNRKERSVAGAPEEPGAIGPSGWTALAVLGALAALWSLFLWMELVLLRSGGSSFCAAGGKLDCSAVWNGAFASEIQRTTGLPVAGWGLVWSAVAFALSLAGLSRAARGRPAGTTLPAVRLTALAGALAVVVMFVASLAAGGVCLGCIGTYVLVAAYALIALRRARASGLAGWPRAAGLSGASAAAAFLLLLYPGLHTPRSMGESGRRAVEAAARPSDSEVPAVAAPSASVGTGNPQRDEQLANFVRSLDPQLKQTLADSLAIYRASPVQQLPPPRALVGAVMAPVRITDFTDILCEHCAALNETLHTLRENVPPGSYSVDARQFPLDGRCNALLEPRKDADDVRCVAAKLQICAAPLGKEPQLAAALFERQQGLTRKTALEIASRILPPQILDGCLDSPKVNAALAEDVAAAGRFDSDGTPIVAINGRKGTSFAPFLYAMILARGNPDHLAFASLAPGDSTAHLH
jgi:serine/threonine-protein kinase